MWCLELVDVELFYAHVLSINQPVAFNYSRENMPSEEAFPCSGKEIGGFGESKYKV